MIKKFLIKLGIIKKPKPKPLKCSYCQKEFTRQQIEEVFVKNLNSSDCKSIKITHVLGIDHKCHTYYTCSDCSDKREKEEQQKNSKINYYEQARKKF